MSRRLNLVLLFVVLAVLLPTTGFFDLYLLPWQSRLILTENPNLWDAAQDAGEGAFYLPFTKFSALPYGPLFYYPTALWLLVLDVTHVIDVSAWDDVGAPGESLRFTGVLKFPNLVVFLAVGLMLSWLRKGDTGRDSMLLWLMNPAAILVCFVMGQNDAWSVAAILYALLFASAKLEGRQICLRGVNIPLAPLSMIALGLGGAIKLHPLLFILPFALVLGSSWRERVTLMGIGGLAFLLPIAPFAHDEFFRDHALFSPQSRHLWDVRLLHVPLFAVGYALAAVAVPMLRLGAYRGLLAAVIGVHALIYLLTDWPPERAAWFIAVLAIPAAGSRVGLVAFMLVTAEVMIRAARFDNDLSAGAFFPLGPQFLVQHGVGDAIDAVVSVHAVERTLFVASGAAVAVAWIRCAFNDGSADRPVVPPYVPAAMLLSLVLYFGCAIAYGNVGYTTPYPTGETLVISGPATVETGFFPIADGLSRIRIDTAGDSQAQGPPGATITDAEGRSVGVDRAELTGDELVVVFDSGATAFGSSYTLRVEVPEGVDLVTVTQPTAFGWLRRDGQDVPRGLRARNHYSRDWGELGSTARDRLRDEAPDIAVISLVLALALVPVWKRLGPRSGEPL